MDQRLEIGHGIGIGKVDDGVRIGGTWIASSDVARLNQFGGHN